MFSIPVGTGSNGYLTKLLKHENKLEESFATWEVEVGRYERSQATSKLPYERKHEKKHKNKEKKKDKKRKKKRKTGPKEKSKRKKENTKERKTERCGTKRDKSC